MADTFGPTSSPFYVVYVQPEVLAKAGDLLKEVRVLAKGPLRSSCF